MLDLAPFRGVWPTQEVAQDYLIPSATQASRLEEMFHVGESAVESAKASRIALDLAIDKNELLNDSKPSLYVYEQRKKDQSFRGIIGLVPTKGSEALVIKEHELIHKHHKEKMVEFFTEAGANPTPVLLSYIPDKEVKHVIDVVIKSQPILEVHDNVQNTTHSLWHIEDDKVEARLHQALKNHPEIYIADGHHRYASHRAMKGDLGHMLACLVSEDELNILPFHRLITLDENVTLQRAIDNLKQVALLESIPEPNQLPTPGEVYMYTRHGWSSLQLHRGLKQNANPKEVLDVFILENWLLEKSFKKEDYTISYIPGTKVPPLLKSNITDPNSEILFVLGSITVEQVRAVADAGLTMPQKSTWIEPKLPVGILTHQY